MESYLLEQMYKRREPKELPLKAWAMIQQLFEENEGYELEILEQVAYVAMSKDADDASMFLADYIGRFMRQMIVRKNQQINDTNQTAYFCAFANDILHKGAKADKFYRDKSSAHVALHVLSYMGYGELKTHFLEGGWKTKCCEAIYENYKDSDIEHIEKEHFTYGQNQYIKPFLKELIAHYEKETVDE